MQYIFSWKDERISRYPIRLPHQTVVIRKAEYAEKSILPFPHSGIWRSEVRLQYPKEEIQKWKRFYWRGEGGMQYIFSEG